MVAWYHDFLVVLSLGSVALQLYVIALIWLVSPPAMSTYRYFLFLYTFFDMLFTFVGGYVVAPDVVLIDATTTKALQAQGVVKHLGQTWCHAFVLVLTFCAALLVETQCYCLIYRFLAIMDNRRFYELFVSIPSFVGFHAFGFATGGVAVVAFHFALSVVPNMDAFLEKYPSASIYVEPNAPLIYISSQSLEAWILGFLLGTAVVVAEGVSFLLAYGILRKLRQNVNLFSAKTYRMHLQLTFLLVLQITTPIVFVMLPTIVTMIIAKAQFAVPQLPVRVMVILLMTLYAPINSLLTLIFVAPYRQFTRKVVLKVYEVLLPRRLRRLLSRKVAPDTNAVDERNVSTVISSAQLERIDPNRSRA